MRCIFAPFGLSARQLKPARLRKAVLPGLLTILLAGAGPLRALGGLEPGALDPSAPAAPPAPLNDDIAFAAEITSVPWTNVLDTTLATPALDDPNCLGPGASVWYQFTPEHETEVILSAEGSDYTVALSACTGAPGNLNQLACSLDKLSFTVPARTTVYILASSTNGAPGGNLVLRALGAPALKVWVSVAGIGKFDQKTGRAAVRGIVVSTRPTTIHLAGTLQRILNRKRAIENDFTLSVECPQEAEWNVVVEGPFGTGSSLVSATAAAYDLIKGQWVQAEVSAIVRLRGGR